MVSKNEELERIIEKSFKKLGNDKYMVFLSLAFVHKRSGPSAIKTGKYNESLLIDDLEKYLLNKFNYNRNKSIKLWIKLKKIFSKEGGSENILDVILKNIDFHKFKYTLFAEYSDIIQKEIKTQLKKMIPQYKALVFTFLEYREDPEIPLFGPNMKFLNQFITERYNLLFDKIIDIKTQSNIGKILIQSGLLFRSKWVKYDGSESEFICAYPIYLDEVADFLINELYKDEFITSHINNKLNQTYSKEQMTYLNKLDHNSYLHEALDRIYILGELNIFTDKPEELSKFIERIIKSNWSEKKKLKWIEIIKETLDNWLELKPTKWQKLGTTLLDILSKFMTRDLVDFSSEIINDFYNWIKIRLDS